MELCSVPAQSHGVCAGSGRLGTATTAPAPRTDGVGSTAGDGESRDDGSATAHGGHGSAAMATATTSHASAAPNRIWVEPGTGSRRPRNGHDGGRPWICDVRATAGGQLSRGWNGSARSQPSERWGRHARNQREHGDAWRFGFRKRDEWDRDGRVAVTLSVRFVGTLSLVAAVGWW